MDYGTYRGIYTIIVLVVFVGIIWWAYSKQSKKRFDNAANSILDDSDVEKKNSRKKEQQVHRD
ncbi:cbb3-type cytochrome oxidase subunit [Catenovulum agarivorans DS-2]|uniref:Cbb3-type cytochrome oxidase subunit n=1 Tax=Catenovulum agarivorans DS-2 TaxID=1328313 RepID=W7QX17_9ALTE|nr:CcoQ/FixQ family Cbb3-type cytochrome c oxidase assembly chaperone [Catenovulum agarivorans]EWH12278.1 cbb3-type cytochrome oxidase subunit [Catenovulum agarivorans DS-2]